MKAAHLMTARNGNDLGSPSDLVTPLPPNRFHLLKLPSSLHMLQARDQAFNTQESYALHGGQEAHRKKPKFPWRARPQ